MPDLPEKEILNKLFSEQEKSSYLHIETEPKIEKENEPLIQKLEKEIYLTKPITDDSGQPLISSPAPVSPKITLPISKSQLTFALTQKVTSSILWLAVWCLRLVKIFGDKVAFREIKEKV